MAIILRKINNYVNFTGVPCDFINCYLMKFNIFCIPLSPTENWKY